jgi:carbon storage regulator CsrA
MLILTRREKESIAVGNSSNGEPMLTVTVLDICGGRVKLGFDGDPSIFIHRWELWQQIRARREQDERNEGAAAPRA